MILDTCQWTCWSFIYIYILKCLNFVHFNQSFIDFFTFYKYIRWNCFWRFSSRSFLTSQFIPFWGKIVLQSCVVFCHVTMQISHNYIFITPHLSLPPLSLFTPLGHDRVPVWVPVLYSNFSPAICFTYGGAFMSVLFSLFILFSCSSTVSTSSFSKSEFPLLFHK